MDAPFRTCVCVFDCSPCFLAGSAPQAASGSVPGVGAWRLRPLQSLRSRGARGPPRGRPGAGRRGGGPRRAPGPRSGRPPPGAPLRSLGPEQLWALPPCANQAALALFLQFRARLWDWARVALLLLLQQRLLPRAWRLLRRARRRLAARRLDLRGAGAEELRALREALHGGRLERDVELGGQTLPAGAEVLASAEELAAAPRRLRWRPPAPAPAPAPERRRPRAAPRLALGEGLKVALLGEAPLLLWGWGHLALEGVSYLLLKAPGWDKGALRAALAQAETVVTLTAIAWFFHRLISWWRDKRSRGRATITDVLGWESSLKEAQVNALKVLMQVVVWGLYLCASLWACGIQVGRVLLFPSVTAVVIGWIGREVVANIISGVVIHLTQPFAQGDWVTLENGSIDGWVQDTGTFYTRVMQWDKRPIYVPNFKLMSMNVQNNSRMTHRRIIFELPLRLRDIPKIPQIVQDMQEMINEHEDVDTVQHRLVRWRAIGEYSATIWVSCYTHPTMEGIRLGSYTAVQQSVLERCSQVVYKHGAEFASLTDRFSFPGEQETPKTFESVITEKLFDTFNGGSRESQLESREQVLRQREREVKERERENEAEAEKLAQRANAVAKAEELARAEERQRRLAAAEAAAGERPQEPERGAAAEGAPGPQAGAAGEPAPAPAAEAAAPEAAAPAPPAAEAEPAGRGEEAPAAGAHEAGGGAEAARPGQEVDGALVAATSGKGDHGTMDGDPAADAELTETLQDGEVPQSKSAKKKRIPVKEMGD